MELSVGSGQGRRLGIVLEGEGTDCQLSTGAAKAKLSSSQPVRALLKHLNGREEAKIAGGVAQFLKGRPYGSPEGPRFSVSLWLIR